MIRVRALSKAFAAGQGAVPALQDVTLSVEAGEFFVLIGASGSGKSTLLRCVAGLERPEGGVIELGDRVVFSHEGGIDLPPQQRRLGMVFQSYAIWPHLTVLENVALPLVKGPPRLSRSDARAQARRVLALVKMEQLADRPAPLLSGGQQQRVALARSIAVSAGVLLMDEPLSNLDPRLREDVREELRVLTRTVGTTVLYVTHDTAEAMALGDRMAVIDAGRLLQIGRPLEIYRRPASRTVAEFLGRVNWLPGRIGPDGRIQTPMGALAAAVPPVGGEVLIGFRPESVRIAPGPVGPDGLEGRLSSLQALGSRNAFAIAVAGHELHGESSVPIDAAPGEPCRFSVPPDEIMVFQPDGSTALPGRSPCP